MKNRELPESLAKQGISRHIKENYNNDKNIICMPRQDSEERGKMLKNKGFLGIGREFSP